MPIFEYNCSNCSHGFELLIHPTTKIKCPECGSQNLAKQFSSFSPSSNSGQSESSAPSNCPTCEIPGGSCGLNKADSFQLIIDSATLEFIFSPLCPACFEKGVMNPDGHFESFGQQFTSLFSCLPPTATAQN